VDCNVGVTDRSERAAVDVVNDTVGEVRVAEEDICKKDGGVNFLTGEVELPPAAAGLVAPANCRNR
jgi:hypothetical protein